VRPVTFDRLGGKPYCVRILSHRHAACHNAPAGQVNERSHEVLNIGTRRDARGR
jgi:hypothetical protein